MTFIPGDSGQPNLFLYTAQNTNAVYAFPPSIILAFLIVLCLLVALFIIQLCSIKNRLPKRKGARVV